MKEDTEVITEVGAQKLFSNKEEIPDPFHMIISHELYVAIRDNQSLRPGTDKVTTEEFEKFKLLFKAFLDALNKHQSNAFSILSTIMSMWGYSRKYCGMCGKPIIGRPGHIENRMVCGRCNESFRITEKLYQQEGSFRKSGIKQTDIPLKTEIGLKPQDVDD